MCERGPSARNPRRGNEIGVLPISGCLCRVGVKATFVASGRNVERFPEIARDVVQHGHEMASENYIHEYPVMFNEAQERESSDRLSLPSSVC